MVKPWERVFFNTKYDYKSSYQAGNIQNGIEIERNNEDHLLFWGYHDKLRKTQLEVAQRK